VLFSFQLTFMQRAVIVGAEVNLLGGWWWWYYYYCRYGCL